MPPSVREGASGMEYESMLDDLTKRSAAARERAEGIARNLTREQLLWRPRPNAWGVGDCLEHMNAGLESYFSKLDPAIAEAKSSKIAATGSERVKSTVAGWLLLAAINPNSKFKVKAPKKLAPPPEPSPEALDAFLRHHERLEAAMSDAAGLDLNRIKFGSPVNALFRINAGDAFRILVGHAERHLNQAERVVQASEFPR